MQHNKTSATAAEIVIIYIVQQVRLSYNQIIVLESIFLYAGLIGSLLIAWFIALQVYRTRQRALRGWLPWALLFLLMLGSGLWIMLNPMEMRGTIFFNQ